MHIIWKIIFKRKEISIPLNEGSITTDMGSKEWSWPNSKRPGTLVNIAKYTHQFSKTTTIIFRRTWSQGIDGVHWVTDTNYKTLESKKPLQVATAPPQIKIINRTRSDSVLSFLPRPSMAVSDTKIKLQTFFC